MGVLIFLIGLISLTAEFLVQAFNHFVDPQNNHAFLFSISFNLDLSSSYLEGGRVSIYRGNQNCLCILGIETNGFLTSEHLW